MEKWIGLLYAKVSTFVCDKMLREYGSIKVITHLQHTCTQYQYLAWDLYPEPSDG